MGSCHFPVTPVTPFLPSLPLSPAPKPISVPQASTRPRLEALLPLCLFCLGPLCNSNHPWAPRNPPYPPHPPPSPRSTHTPPYRTHVPAQLL
uniref:Uncharacterized protein n=1 Tax=Knipowitschia caucasica TaxID=637954 RepID=A0AAV2KXE6_KNICA